MTDELLSERRVVAETRLVQHAYVGSIQIFVETDLHESSGQTKPEQCPHYDNQCQRDWKPPGEEAVFAFDSRRTRR